MNVGFEYGIKNVGKQVGLYTRNRNPTHCSTITALSLLLTFFINTKLKTQNDLLISWFFSIFPFLISLLIYSP